MIVQHPSDRGFYCSALGASVAGLVANANQTPGSVSMASCVYHLVELYVMMCCHGVDIDFCSSWYSPCIIV